MLTLLRIELYKISRRPRTYIAFVAIAAIVFIFQFAFKVDGQRYGLYSAGCERHLRWIKTKTINGLLYVLHHS